MGEVRMSVRPRGYVAPRLLVAAALLVLLGACRSGPGVTAPAAPAAVATSLERASAVAEIRARAAAGDEMPYPDPFQAAQTSRLAARDEPLTAGEVEAIEAELALIARRRTGTASAGEIAALEARARELRRLVLQSTEDPVRR
jgi:hypothetical protein